MNVIDLFSGIGGMALGFQRAGFQVAALCESDPFAAGILRRAWPDTPCYPDIRSLSAERLRDDGIPRAHVLCGGFPCQDISAAGRGAGLDGERSGLWREMLRLVHACRPDWVVAENVPALRVRGADRVLADLEAAGYACWPLLVGAAHAGAPHRRNRVFILAHAVGARLEDRVRGATGSPTLLPIKRPGGWAIEPGMGRVAHGVPARMDRLRALGNAVVPAVAEMIAQALLHAQAFIDDQAAVKDQAALAERTRSAKLLRNLATFGPTTARQYPA